MVNLKKVYAVPTEETALSELDSFEEKWGGNTPRLPNPGVIIVQTCPPISSIQKQSDA